MRKVYRIFGCIRICEKQNDLRGQKQQIEEGFNAIPFINANGYYCKTIGHLI